MGRPNEYIAYAGHPLGRAPSLESGVRPPSVATVSLTPFFLTLAVSSPPHPTSRFKKGRLSGVVEMSYVMIVVVTRV